MKIVNIIKGHKYAGLYPLSNLKKIYNIFSEKPQGRGQIEPPALLGLTQNNNTQINKGYRIEK